MSNKRLRTGLTTKLAYDVFKKKTTLYVTHLFNSNLFFSKSVDCYIIRKKSHEIRNRNRDILFKYCSKLVKKTSKLLYLMNTF